MRVKLNELNKLIGCDKANTSRAIGDLEEKGIIFKNNIDCSEKKYLVKFPDPIREKIRIFLT